MTDNIWFRARTFGGWGWTPVTWQGWLVTIIFICLFIVTPKVVKKYFPNSDPKRGPIVLGLILVEVFLLFFYWRKTFSTRKLKQHSKMHSQCECLRRSAISRRQKK